VDAVIGEIVWEDPPVAREGAPWGTPAFTAAQLRENPGRWARVAIKTTGNAARTAAVYINTGHVAAWRPAGAYEATARTVWIKDASGVKKPEYRLYARFVGEDQ
jgi:hypothetical protein